MKKTLKNISFGVILGGLIFGGIGTIAVTLTADQIKYTPGNTNFKVNNLKEAMDEIYKIAEYKIKPDTYFYVDGTSGADIVRYVKKDNKYYLCDENGKIINETEQNVSNLTLIEYNLTSAANISSGYAGFANEKLYLGDGTNSEKSHEEILSLFYGSPSETFTLPGTGIGTNSSGSYKSDTINLYKTPDGKRAILSSISFNIEIEAHANYIGDGAYSTGTYNIKLTDGTVISSNTYTSSDNNNDGSFNVSINMFDVKNIDDNTDLIIEFSGRTSASGTNHQYSMAYAWSNLTTITLNYLILE